MSKSILLSDDVVFHLQQAGTNLFNGEGLTYCAIAEVTSAIGAGDKDGTTKWKKGQRGKQWSLDTKYKSAMIDVVAESSGFKWSTARVYVTQATDVYLKVGVANAAMCMDILTKIRKARDAATKKKKEAQAKGPAPSSYLKECARLRDGKWTKKELQGMIKLLQSKLETV